MRKSLPVCLIQTASRLNLYRYFAVPNIEVADERYTVHFEGALSERILSYYYPATCKDGNALEGQCTIHLAPPEPIETTPPVETDPLEPPDLPPEPDPGPGI